MAKYRIKVIAHQLKSNKLGKAGETVDESQLLAPAKDLLKAGFIEAVDGEEEVNSDLDISTLKLPDLKVFAEQNGFNIEGLTKKKDILDALDSQIKEKEVNGELIVK